MSASTVSTAGFADSLHRVVCSKRRRFHRAASHPMDLQLTSHAGGGSDARDRAAAASRQRNGAAARRRVAEREAAPADRKDGAVVGAGGGRPRVRGLYVDADAGVEWHLPEGRDGGPAGNGLPHAARNGARPEGVSAEVRQTEGQTREGGWMSDARKESSEKLLDVVIGSNKPYNVFVMADGGGTPLATAQGEELRKLIAEKFPGAEMALGVMTALIPKDDKHGPFAVLIPAGDECRPREMFANENMSRAMKNILRDPAVDKARKEEQAPPPDDDEGIPDWKV